VIKRVLAFFAAVAFAAIAGVLLVDWLL